MEKFGVGVVTEQHACRAGLRAPGPPAAAVVAAHFIIDVLIKHARHSDSRICITKSVKLKSQIVVKYAKISRYL